MALVCLPPQVVKKLKEAATKGEIKVAELYDMTSKQRRDLFSKYSDDSLGKFVNTEFEKAMISKQQDAMTKWAEKTFTPRDKSGPAYKSVLDKIKGLDELGVLNPESEDAFLEDLVTDKLGITVSADEVKAISARAKIIDKAQEALGDDLGHPDKFNENLAFFKAKKDMDDYLQSLNPANRLKIATGTIGRGMMLFSIKSPLLNIGSNIEVGLTEAIGRRIAAGTIKGTDSKLAKQYIELVHVVYQSTGYDLSRMTSLADSGASGGRVLGDSVHSQGKGLVRKSGQIVEDVVFKQLMGAPDAVFGAVHFADSVNLNALKFAGKDESKARELMVDALRLDPLTDDGKLLRAQGILDAQVATWTNKSWASDVSLGVRKILNNLSGDARIGDYVFPFVKTPANVIATGLDYAGWGIPRALGKTIKAIRAGDLKDPAYIQSAARDLVRAGLGLTAAVAIVANIPDENFVGAYDPARQQIEQLKNSHENSIKIGSKWVSTDWFGPLAVSINGMLYARKYGRDGNTGEKAFQYGKGLRDSAFQLPGVGDVAGYVAKTQRDAGKDSGDAAESTKNYVLSQLYSRLVPSFIGDIAKATDDKQRKAEKGVQALQANIPVLRNHLPEKQNVFGEKLKAEPGVSTVLFGSRVKTDRGDKLTKEIQRVDDATGKSITLTDWSDTSNKDLAAFRKKVGDDKYKEATLAYGKKLRARLETNINKSDYKSLDDSDKLKVLNDADAQATKETLKQYGYRSEKSTAGKSLLSKFR